MSEGVDRSVIGCDGAAAPVLGPSLFASALAALILLGVAHHITRGFEAWTFDERRLLAVNAGELAAALPQLRTAQNRLWSTPDNAASGPELYLVDFIYTSCPSVCQALGSEFYRLQQRLIHDDLSSRIGLVSVSIDRLRDGVPELAAYARLHKADARQWTIGVPTSDAALAAVLRGFQVVAVDDGQGGFVHNGAIHLVDAKGRLLALYGYEQWPRALEDALAHLKAPPP